ncbi:MAG: hypothetical protein ACLRT5_18360 [Lachnospiraceae bacterium]
MRNVKRNISETVNEQNPVMPPAVYTVDASTLPLLEVLGPQFQNQQKNLNTVTAKVQTLKKVIETTDPEKRDTRWHLLVSLVLERLAYDLEHLAGCSRIMAQEQQEVLAGIHNM